MEGEASSFVNGPAAVETLITSTGGCGLFQVLFVLGTYSAFCPIAWSTIFMAFGIYNPSWKCLDHEHSIGDFGYNYPNLSYSINKSDELCEVFESCQRVEFNKDTSTIVSEWGLLCSLDWIPPFIISMQMVGVLFGAYCGGYIVDKLGRKVVIFGSVLINGILSLIAPFSINWQMFTILRFLLGVQHGSSTSAVFLFPAEFLATKWRGILSTAPVWGICCVIFAGLAVTLRDWKYIHIANGICSILLCMLAFWIPESMRWLAVKGKLIKAVDVANKIAKTNKTPMPDISVLKGIVEKQRKVKSKHSFLDIFSRDLYKRTLIISFVWFTLAVVAGVIAFSAKALSGDFFVNLTLISSIPIVCYPVIPLAAEKLGRKLGIMIFFGISCVSCFSFIVVYFIAPLHVQNICLTVFTTLAYGGMECAWAIAIVFTYELFPTVVRGLGYGCANGTARIGGIIAPYLIPKNHDTLYISFIVLGILLFISSVLVLFLPETKGRPLEDTLKGKQVDEENLQAQRNDQRNSKC